MQLLFVIDNYPPLDKGGYAQLCYDLAHEIRNRGHSVTVLCAGPMPSQPDIEPVMRQLAIPLNWGDRWPVFVQQTYLMARRTRHNLRVFDRLVMEVRPDAILLWPTEYVDQRVMAAAESLADTVTAYYLAGVSPTDPTIIEQYWVNPGHSVLARIGKRLLRPVLGHYRREKVSLRLQHVMCVSDYERRRVVTAGVHEENTWVVHNGIDLMQFPFLGLPSSRRKPGTPLRVLYAGRLVEDKGAHTLVDAMATLYHDNAAAAVTTTLLGTGPAEYIQHIDSTVARFGLTDIVQRYDWINRSDMPAFLANYDVLVLPTIRPEALSRAVQEAMATGLVVVATSTGGTLEIVHDGITGLVFPPGDATTLARQLMKLRNDIELCDRLAKTGRELVVQSFTMSKMADAALEHFASWLGEFNCNAKANVSF